MSILPVGSKSSEVKTKQVGLLFGHLPVILLATSANSAILVLTLWNHVSHWILVAWLVCIQLTAALRGVLLQRFRRNPTAEDLGPWFFAGSLSSGVFWGAAGIILYAAESVP